MRYWIFLLGIILFCYEPSVAQNKKTKTIAKKVEKIIAKSQPSENILFQTMLQNADKIMVIDSVVVDKDDFIKHIPLNSNNGTIIQSQDKTIFTNGFNNKRIIADGDSISGRGLYKTELTNKGWERNKAIKELNKAFSMIDFPFILSDGTTLFFAGKGENSLGGYDIFTTRFDAENGVFYVAENYGMPYSSTANDYLLAIDDIYNIGWLVSDRYQPTNKVCIYTFIPNKSGEKLSQEKLSEHEKRALAMLNSIKDTWKFGNIEQAKTRLSLFNDINKRQNSTTENVSFVINDKIIYTNKSSFKSAKAKELFAIYERMQKKLEATQTHLNKLRTLLINNNKQKLTNISSEILMLERAIVEKRNSLIQCEKDIRIQENKMLKP